VPTRIALKDGLLTGIDDPGAACLLGSRCPQCARFNFPAQDLCPYCASAGCETVPLSPRGAVEVCTTVINRPPGYDGAVPFGFGVVELPEGLRIISRIRNPEGLQAGAPVRLVLECLCTDAENRELTTYAFAADDGPRSPGSSMPQDKGASLHSGLRTRDSGLGTQDSKLPGRPVYIAAVGLHPFGRFADKTVTDMGVAAVRMALAEAGPAPFQAAYCGTVYSGVAAGHKVLTALGVTGMPIINVEAGCASGGAALGLGASAIASGRCERVLVFGMEKMPKGIIRSSFFAPWREQGGLAVTPAYFALRAQRLMRDSGVTREHLAQVSVKNHRNGVHNPHAMFRKELSLDAVLASPLVCDPLRLYMLCSPNEGAAAVVLSATPSPVRISAATLRSHLPGNVLGEHTPLSGLADDAVAAPTELAAREAYEIAGIGPGDLDVVELQDTDSARELLSYEELGLCPPGACGQWLVEGRTEIGGQLPVNPSGGLLSKGEPLGASGLGQVVELYWQLRGAAGPRQVANARVGLAHTVGRGANASVVILERQS
jgi:acetyl-CoA C-acetyltransferase